MGVTRWRNIPLADAISLVFGTLLFLAPWIFDLSNDTARQNAWYAGALIALVAIMELAAFAVWAEWMNLTLGVWVVASPWIMDFSDRTTALWVHLIAGSVVAISSAVDLYVVRRGRGRDASGRQRHAGRS